MLRYPIINGDTIPHSDIIIFHSPATFFRPSGEYYQHAQAVWSQYERDATSFESGSEGQLEILHIAVSNGLAYCRWVP